MTRLGCIKSPPDARDLMYHVALAARIPPVLPRSIDYSKDMTRVRDQGNEGSCVGHAAVAMKEYQERGATRWCQKDLSERYLYEHAKEIDGMPLPHEGTTIRAAMEVLYKRGVCPESCWRYMANARLPECRDADRKAEPNRIASYVALGGVLSMRQALVSNGPFVIGVQAYSPFMDPVDGDIPLPIPSIDHYEGNHAICIVGYDDGSSRFKFKNSWGSGWGDHGYGYLGYDYMASYSFDGWLAADLVNG